MPLTLKIKKLHPDATIPTFAHSEDAGMDLFCLEKTIIKKGERKKIGTGISIEMPDIAVNILLRS
jgi:dUTP pyrophosphatase